MLSAAEALDGLPGDSLEKLLEATWTHTVMFAVVERVCENQAAR
jgi:hypothetical protein